jgi:hypothetical protein
LAEIAINTGATASNTALKLLSPGMPMPIANPMPVAFASVKPSNRLCGSCETPNPVGSAFCENCGKSL